MLSALMTASIGAAAQSVTASGAISSADSIVTGIKDMAFHLAAGIIALVAVFLLVWQGMKSFKGDPQYKDSLMSFGGSLLVVAILMEVIKAIF